MRSPRWTRPDTDKNRNRIAKKMSSLFSNYNVCDVDRYFYLHSRTKAHITISHLCTIRWRRIKFSDWGGISFFFPGHRQNRRKRGAFQTLGCQTSERGWEPSNTLDFNRCLSVPLWSSHFSPIKKLFFLQYAFWLLCSSLRVLTIALKILCYLVFHLIGRNKKRKMFFGFTFISCAFS